MPLILSRPPPLLADFDDEEREAVLGANRSFYRAFNERDYQAMEQLWAPTGAIICIHPGHAPLVDRADILESWRAVLGNPEAPKIRCVDELVVGRTGLALVVCREILPNANCMATNSFVRLNSGWHMAGHHASIVPAADHAQTAAGATSPTRDRRKLH
jgi:hypothetical protein